MKKRIKDETGIALMLVLAALLIISTLVVDFAYNAHIAYEVAATERDRLKATYLAYSAYHLVRFMVKSERQLRQRYASLLKDLSGGDVSSEPFCKMFPLSTGLLQGLTLEPQEREQKEPKKTNVATATESEDLFDLGGEFEGSCDTEDGKINLNTFWQPPAQISLYEEQKNLLYSLLNDQEFEPIFKGHVDEVRKVVTAIADWVDPDDQVNEAPGLPGGYEDSEYSDLPYKAKNGKYLSRAELLLIPGVGDDLYRLLGKYVTVYGDNKINLCQARDEIVRAFLLNYSTTTPGVAPLNPEDETRMTPLLDAVKQVCAQPSPQPAQLASLISSQLGGGGGSATSGTMEEGKSPVSLASKISTANRFYSIETSAKSGEVEVRIHAVLDTTKTDPNLWKTLYFLVE